MKKEKVLVQTRVSAEAAALVRARAKGAGLTVAGWLRRELIEARARATGDPPSKARA